MHLCVCLEASELLDPVYMTSILSMICWLEPSWPRRSQWDKLFSNPSAGHGGSPTQLGPMEIVPCLAGPSHHLSFEGLPNCLVFGVGVHPFECGRGEHIWLQTLVTSTLTVYLSPRNLAGLFPNGNLDHRCIRFQQHKDNGVVGNPILLNMNRLNSCQ